jgi:hypothetical protein
MLGRSLVVVVGLVGQPWLGGCRHTGGGGGQGEASSSGTGSGGVDGTGSDSTETDTGPSVPEIQPFSGGIRRLLASEYVASLELLLGAEAAAAAAPPDDISQGGFDAVGAATISLAAEAIELYERSAAAVAEATVEHPQTLGQSVPCVVDGPFDDACYEQVAITFGRLAYRRPLESTEVDRVATIAADARVWANGDFATGLRYELMAVLQSPYFLHVVEVGEDDPDSDYRPLTDYELATRMSFVILGRTPDAELLALAEDGQLETADQVRAVAEDLVERPEARVGMARFFDEFLRLRELPTTAKNAELYPAFSPELGEAMRQETQLLVRDIVWERDVDFRELLTADYTYVDRSLAALYGVEFTNMDNSFERVSWPTEHGRAGYLSQASFLTHQSGPLRTSPTKRGRFVQTSLLCTNVAPPPEGVPDLPEPMEGETLRERLERHMEAPECAGCHAIMDPIGFAFEPYDAIGAWRTEDNGSPIDPAAEIEGLGAWNDAAELGERLAQDERLIGCMVRNIIRGRLGAEPKSDHRPGLSELEQQFVADELRIKRLLVEMVASDLFRRVDEPK